MPKKLKNKLPVADTVGYPVASKPTKSDQDRERRYRAENALSDIERAEKHKSDKNLMSDVKTLAKEKVADLKKFC